MIKCYKVDYTTTHWVWDAQHFHKISLDAIGPPTMCGYEVTDDYMEWYLPRTHPKIIPPTTEELGMVSQFLVF